jgi:hypothetical protein
VVTGLFSTPQTEAFLCLSSGIGALHPCVLIVFSQLSKEANYFILKQTNCILAGPVPLKTSLASPSEGRSLFLAWKNSLQVIDGFSTGTRSKIM